MRNDKLESVLIIDAHQHFWQLGRNDCTWPRSADVGSDWPVLALAGEYEGWLQVAKALTGLSDPNDLDAVFRGTAARFYRTKA